MSNNTPSITSSTIAYLRASTDKQDVNNQKLEILEYARKHDLKIDVFIEVTTSSRSSSKQRRIDELTEKLNSSDTVIATELSRLGRSTSEVIDLINTLLKNGIRVILIKQNLDMQPGEQDMTSKVMITLFSLFAELERDLISMRTREALSAKKAKGIKLGKPKGVIQKSMYDKDRANIEELIKLGLSIKKISKFLGNGSYISLNTYINKRGLKQTKNI